MTKRDLQEYKDLRGEIDDLEKKITELRERAFEAKHPYFSHMPKGSAPISMEDLIVKKVDLERILVKKQIELLDKAVEIERAIDFLPVNERRVMRKRYIDCWKWEDFEAAYERGEFEFSVSTVKRLHRQALRRMEIYN